MYQEKLPGKLVTRRIKQNCEKAILITKGVKRGSPLVDQLVVYVLINNLHRYIRNASVSLWFLWALLWSSDEGGNRRESTSSPGH